MRGATGEYPPMHALRVGSASVARMSMDGDMPLLRSVGRAVGATARGTRAAARGVRVTATGGARTGRWVARNVRTARNLGGDGNLGMMRLLDLHAASCAGDTLIMIGLASTIFFGVPTDAARSRVALYLLVTMVPFALLAPLVGPLLDRFRHGRRYALATTMLGRGVLAWVISANLVGFWLYPAAFGVLVLSRAYGVARSAADDASSLALAASSRAPMTPPSMSVMRALNESTL